METDSKFIFGILIYYGFLFTCYALGGQFLSGFIPNSPQIGVPAQPSGNIFYDFLTGIGSFVATIWGFFTIFFNPFANSAAFGVLGFLNWALVGVSVYMFIKLIRGLP
jgi:hypothetical protein